MKNDYRFSVPWRFLLFITLIVSFSFSAVENVVSSARVDDVPWAFIVAFKLEYRLLAVSKEGSSREAALVDP